MKVRIYEDELYPFYYLYTDVQEWGKAAELTEEEVQEYWELAAKHLEWQKRLRKLYREAK